MRLKRSSVGLSILALGALMAVPAGAQLAPDSASALTIRISLAVRQLWVLNAAGDTLLSASVAVGSGRTLTGESRSWTFNTPRGEARVVAKQEDPVWIPPDWHYAEVAAARGLRLARLPLDTPVAISKGRFLVVRDFRIGVIDSDSAFRLLEPAEEVVFDNTLFIPPFGTEQRRIAGTLGRYRLVLSNGVGLHGTPDTDSVGRAVTHGCIRLRDEAIAWLFEHVPVGTRVTIY